MGSGSTKNESFYRTLQNSVYCKNSQLKPQTIQKYQFSFLLGKKHAQFNLSQYIEGFFSKNKTVV